MAKLEKSHLALIKRLLKMDEWDAMQAALEEYINELRAQQPSGRNGFETLRALHRKEGGVDHLREFFNKLERIDLE